MLDGWIISYPNFADLNSLKLQSSHCDTKIMGDFKNIGPCQLKKNNRDFFSWDLQVIKKRAFLSEMGVPH